MSTISKLSIFRCTGGRQISYFDLAYIVFPHLKVSEKDFRCEIMERSYTRMIAVAKPPLSLENWKKRIDLASQHFHWSNENWMIILWTSETWMTDAGTVDVGRGERSVPPSEFRFVEIRIQRS